MKHFHFHWKYRYHSMCSSVQKFTSDRNFNELMRNARHRERSTRESPRSEFLPLSSLTNERISIRFQLVRETGQTTWRVFHGSKLPDIETSRETCLSVWVSKAARRPGVRYHRSRSKELIASCIDKIWHGCSSFRSRLDRSRTLRLTRVSRNGYIVKREQRTCQHARNKATMARVKLQWSTSNTLLL